MMQEEPLTILTIGEGIKVIVITGGPCSGKTTALSRLHRMLSDRGYKVLISPESATKLILAGMSPGELPPVVFQEEIFLDILSQEERLFSIATKYRSAGRKVVVLCDRGTMDGEAYIEPFLFEAMIKRHGLTCRQLCDERYHAVIHLRTAALGAVGFYTLANNGARKETPEEAIILDKRTLDAWTRHQHPRVIDNSTDFEGKLHRVFVEICAILGDPIPFEMEDKFLIEPFDPRIIPVRYRESFIIQNYLVSPTAEEERRVRVRSDDDGASYYYTIKRNIGPGVRTEEEKMITRREYEMLLTLRKPERATVEKRRICFFWEEQFFEIDLIKEPYPGLALMEAERTDRTPNLKLPPFVRVKDNVTHNLRYSNAEIARCGYMPAVA